MASSDPRHDAHVSLEHVGMQFPGGRVLDDITFDVKRGHIGVIIGGSGAGKTTLLRIIIGLLRPSDGAVRVDGVDIARMRATQLRAARAKWGMVFQYSALLDALTVLENVTLPLREHERLPPAEVRRRLL